MDSPEGKEVKRRKTEEEPQPGPSSGRPSYPMPKFNVKFALQCPKVKTLIIQYDPIGRPFRCDPVYDYDFRVTQRV